MRPRSAVLMRASVLAAAASLPAQSSAANDVFTVRADFESERIVRDVLAIATKARDVVAYELGVRSFDGPLEIHLYRDEAGYVAADRRYTGGRFARNRAFSTRRDLTAHLVWEPAVSATQLRRFGIPEQMRRLVAHEATHLLLYSASPSRGRFQPRWLTEGLAQWVEEQVVESEGVAPWVSHDRFTARTVLASERAPTVSGLSLDVDFGIGSGPRYSVDRMFFQWLRTEHADRLGPLLRSLPTRPATSALPRTLRSELLPGGQWGVWDQSFRRYVHAQPAPWIEPVRSLSRVSDGFLQASLQGRRALAWVSQAQPAELRIRVRVELLSAAAEPGMAHLLLGGSETSALAVRLRSDGAVALSRWRGPGKGFDDLAVRGAGVRAGKSVTVELVSRVTDVLVSVDGREVLRHDIRVAAGRVGIGVAPGSAALWQAIERFDEGVWCPLDEASVDGQSAERAGGEAAADKDQ